MSTFETDYKNLVEDVLCDGVSRTTRAGNTWQKFGATLRIDCLRNGYFPILTRRRIFYQGVLGELAAFLRGATTVEEFEAAGCNYWRHNAEQWHFNHYPDPLRVGRIYGAQWRNWEGDSDFPGLDQMQALVQGLKTDPMSRRHILTTWNPGELDLMCLPPCHILAQFNVSSLGYLDCIVTMRSVDLCLGLPSDIVLYAALLVLLALQTGLKPGELIFHMGDAHVYKNHLTAWERYYNAPDHKLPRFAIKADATIDNFTNSDLQLLGYEYSPPITFELN